MANLLRSYLFWFVVLGSSIFAIDAEFGQRPDRIVVDDQVLRQIKGSWEAQMRRPPTEPELIGLARGWVEEELWYREARRLALDEGDLIVRRRLVQIIQFMAEQSESDTVDDAALRDYFEQHLQAYSLPVRYSFSQVFVADKSRAEGLHAALQATINWQSLGEPNMLNPSYSLRTGREVGTALGESFANGLAALSPSADWQGPLQSEFGWHWVRLDEKRAPSALPFEEIRDRVQSDYLYEARQSQRQRYLEGLHARYDVEWPGKPGEE